MVAKTEDPAQPVQRGRGRPRGHSGAAQREEIIRAVLAAAGPLSRNDVSRFLGVLHALAHGDRPTADRVLKEATENRETLRDLTRKLRAVLKDLGLPERRYLETADLAPITQIYLALDRLRKDGRIRKCADTAGADTLWMLREQTCP